MNETRIIVLVFVVISCLVLAVSISQNLTKRRIKRQRMLNSLAENARKIHALLAIFPPRYLSNDANSLLVKMALRNTERLIGLEPNDPVYQDDLYQYQTKMNELSNKVQGTKPFTLNSQKQASGLRHGLRALNKALISQLNAGNVTRDIAGFIHREIKVKLARISIEEYLLLARKAADESSKRIAHHYFMQAHKLLSLTDPSTQDKAEIEEIEHELELLEQEIESEAEPSGSEEDPVTALSKEWDEVGKREDWKKKTF